MEDGKCSKKFPKPFQRSTTVNEDVSHPMYRRRSPQDGGLTAQKGRTTIDNSWVVPYNPYLSKRFNCHINIEMCGSPVSAKYMFKYVTKGPDRAMVSTDVRNEISDYEDMRSVGSSEASWKLFAFPIAKNWPAVQVIYNCPSYLY